MRLLAMSLVLLAACTSTPEVTPDEHAWAAAALNEWRAAGLPAPDLGRCDQVMNFQIRLTADRADFVQYCRTTPEAAAACNVWGSNGAWFGHDVPLVVIAPGVQPAPWIVIHELLHKFIGCTGVGPAGLLEDKHHTLPTVWVNAGGQDSIEWKAREPFQ